MSEHAPMIPSSTSITREQADLLDLAHDSIIVRDLNEEIAALIGTTRETVTRTLSEFRSKHLVALHGSNLMISNRRALETLGTD